MRRIQRFEQLEPRRLLAVGFIPVDVQVTSSDSLNGLMSTETSVIRFDGMVLNPKLNAPEDIHLTNVVFSTVYEARGELQGEQLVVASQTDAGPHDLDVYLDPEFNLLLVETVGPEHVPGSFSADLGGSPVGAGDVTSSFGSFIYFSSGDMEGVFSHQWNGTLLGDPVSDAFNVPIAFEGAMPPGIPVPDSSLGSISGRVFRDANGNGVRDIGESGASGVVAVLLQDSVEMERMDVDSDGYYGFYNLTGDHFQVQFIDRPIGWEFTAINVGSDQAIDSDADPRTGATALLDFSSRLAQLNVDAGLKPNAADAFKVDTIGLYQPDVSLFHLKESFTPGTSDQYALFGPGNNAGWVPLVGDWNGDGTDTIGLYQPDISLFHLKDSFAPGASDHYFAFGPGGNAGWIPIVGDWNGDGNDTIGLYQPDISLFHLKDSFTPGASDHYFAFGPGGNAGWVPVTGDWNGDGVDTIGLYQPDLSLFHLKDSFTPGASDHYFAFGPGGNAGWTPLSGDWNGDGVDTIGLFQPSVSLFHLKDSLTPGASDHYFAFGPGGNAGWVPLTGDWNGAQATAPIALSGLANSLDDLGNPVGMTDGFNAIASASGVMPESRPAVGSNAVAKQPTPTMASETEEKQSRDAIFDPVHLLDEIFAQW